MESFSRARSEEVNFYKQDSLLSPRSLRETVFNPFNLCIQSYLCACLKIP